MQGLARGLGVPADRHVASPTFALINEHPGRVPLVHADLYRVADARELEELGLTDAFDRAAVAIEWLDRFPDAAPAERLEITIAIEADGTRELTFQPHGDRAARPARPRWSDRVRYSGAALRSLHGSCQRVGPFPAGDGCRSLQPL